MRLCSSRCRCPVAKAPPPDTTVAAAILHEVLRKTRLRKGTSPDGMHCYQKQSYVDYCSRLTSKRTRKPVFSTAPRQSPDPTGESSTACAGWIDLPVGRSVPALPR